MGFLSFRRHYECIYSALFLPFARQTLSIIPILSLSHMATSSNSVNCYQQHPLIPIPPTQGSLVSDLYTNTYLTVIPTLNAEPLPARRALNPEAPPFVPRAISPKPSDSVSNLHKQITTSNVGRSLFPMPINALCSNTHTNPSPVHHIPPIRVHLVEPA